MATSTIYTLPEPTPKQSQYLKFGQTSIDANAIAPVVEPGYYKGVPRVYEIHNVMAYLIASAAAANRTLNIQIEQYLGQYNNLLFYATTGNITASQAGRAIIGPVNVTTQDLTLGGTTVIGYAHLARPMILQGNDRINFVVGSVQAGDRLWIWVQGKYLNHIENITER